MQKKRDISKAKTIGEFISAINAEFGWFLPTSTDLLRESALGKIWALEVTVAKSPRPNVIYEARTQDVCVLVENLKGSFVITVRDTGDARPT